MDTIATMSDDPLMSHVLRSLETINGNVSALGKELGEVKTGLARVEERLDSMPKCMSPSDCGDMKMQLVELKRVQDEHALIVANAKFGWKLIGMLCGACSTLGGAAGWAISHFSK